MDGNDANVAADQLAGAGLRMLAGTIVDNAGVTRTKVIPVARLRQAVESGVGLSPVFAVMCADDGITESASYGGPAGDMRLVPDLSAAVLVDQSTGLGWAPLNQFDQELRPMEICSRQVLARVTDSAAAAGISYRMSFETEFTLFRPDGQGEWTFAHEGPGYSLRALNRQQLPRLGAARYLAAVGVTIAASAIDTLGALARGFGLAGRASARRDLEALSYHRH